MRKIFILAIPAVLAACSSEPSVTATNASVADIQNQVAAAGGEVKLKPGRWETEVSMNMTMPAGVPNQGPQKRTGAACLTPEQANSKENPFAGAMGANCKYDKFSMAGGKIDATTTCNMQGMTLTGTVDGEVAPESFTMRSTSVASGAGAGPMAGLKTETTITAKHAGDCRGDEAKAPTPAAG